MSPPATLSGLHLIGAFLWLLISVSMKFLFPYMFHGGRGWAFRIHRWLGLIMLLGGTTAVFAGLWTTIVYSTNYRLTTLRAVNSLAILTSITFAYLFAQRRSIAEHRLTAYVGVFVPAMGSVIGETSIYMLHHLMHQSVSDAEFYGSSIAFGTGLLLVARQFLQYRSRDVSKLAVQKIIIKNTTFVELGFSVHI